MQATLVRPGMSSATHYKQYCIEMQISQTDYRKLKKAQE